MIVSLLMGLLSDLIFGSASTLRRSYRDDVERHVARRGLRSDTPRQSTAH